MNDMPRADFFHALLVCGPHAGEWKDAPEAAMALDGTGYELLPWFGMKFWVPEALAPSQRQVHVLTALVNGFEPGGVPMSDDEIAQSLGIGMESGLGRPDNVIRNCTFAGFDMGKPGGDRTVVGAATRDATGKTIVRLLDRVPRLPHDDEPMGEIAQAALGAALGRDDRDDLKDRPPLRGAESLPRGHIRGVAPAKRVDTIVRIACLMLDEAIHALTLIAVRRTSDLERLTSVDDAVAIAEKGLKGLDPDALRAMAVDMEAIGR